MSINISMSNNGGDCFIRREIEIRLTVRLPDVVAEDVGYIEEFVTPAVDQLAALQSAAYAKFKMKAGKWITVDGESA